MFELHRVVRTALVTTLLVAACGDSAEPAALSTPDSGPVEAPRSPPIVRWVGAVEETDVQVAVLVGRGKARLYFCGGAETYASKTRWFDLAYDGGEHLEFEEENWRVHSHLTAGGVVGEVELGDGVTRVLRAQLVAPATLAGLYEGKADCGHVGLIVSQASKGAAATGQGACVGTGGEGAQPVSVIAPITAEAGTIAVRIPGGGDATLLLRAATLTD